MPRYHHALQCLKYPPMTGAKWEKQAWSKIRLKYSAQVEDWVKSTIVKYMFSRIFPEKSIFSIATKNICQKETLWYITNFNWLMKIRDLIVLRFFYFKFLVVEDWIPTRIHCHYFLSQISFRREFWYLVYIFHHFNFILHCVKSVCIRSYSGPYFPAFRLNTERYSVSLRI